MATTIQNAAVAIAAADKNKYKLRPIIILITEEDRAAFDWLLRNKEELYGRGYRTVNFEQCCDLPWNVNSDWVKQIGANRKAFANGKYKSEAEFGLAWHTLGIRCSEFAEGFFAACSDICQDKRWSYNFIDVEHSKIKSRSLEQIRKELKLERETKFSQAISQSSDARLGGSITIIGSNHVTVYNLLRAINSTCAENAIFITMQKYTPLVCDGLDAKILTDINQARKNNYDKHAKERCDDFKPIVPSGSLLNADYTDPKFLKVVDGVVLKKIPLVDPCKAQVNAEKGKDAADSKGSAELAKAVTTTTATANAAATQGNDNASGNAALTPKFDGTKKAGSKPEPDNGAEEVPLAKPNVGMTGI